MAPGPNATKRLRWSEGHEGTIIAVLGLLVLLLAAGSLLLGRFPISPVEGAAMLLHQAFPDLVEQTWTGQQASIFFNVRAPRIVLALLIGCCLSAAGAAFQGTFQNPLVSPDLLGASQGAALGAAIAILLGLSSLQISMWAFVFSLITVALVVFISMHARGNPITVVILAGVMVSSLFSAGVSYTKLVADPNDTLPAITYWLMGSLTGAKFADIQLVTFPMAVGLIVLFALRWRINILTMGDDEAATMGVNAKLVRLLVMVAATLVTASSVAVSGMIGWVGLVIPHLCRMLVGCDYRKLLPASMVMGAGFLLLVDDIARVATTMEIPIGILTAFVGAPFFLYLITKGRKI